MYRFFQDKSAEVDRRIIVLAVIMVICSFYFFRIKETAHCEHSKSISRLEIVLLTDKDQDIKETENCEADGAEDKSNPDKSNPDKSNPGDSIPPVDIIDPTYPGVDPESPYNPAESVPLSYFEGAGNSLKCVNMDAHYNFTIRSDAPPQAKGTQKVTIENNKGWDLWFKVLDVETKNHLTTSLSSTKYVKIKDGDKEELHIPWHWDAPFGYTGERGKATIQIRILCDEPPKEQIYRPTPGNFSLSVDNVTEDSLSLSWSAAAHADYYRVYQWEYDSDTDSHDKIVYEGENLSFIAISLKPDTQYLFDVHAYNVQNGEAHSYSERVVKTKGSSKRPSKPTNFKITGATETTMDMKWDAVPNATSYTVRVRDAIVWSGTKLSYTATNLVSGQHYNIWVRANNEYGSSDFVLTDAWTKGESPYPGTPSNMRVTKVTDDSMTLEWDSNKNATSYQLNLFDKKTVIVKGTSYTVTGLEPDTYYFYYLHSKNDWGLSSERAYVNGRTSGTNLKPKQPSNFVITDISNNEMTLKWESVPGAIGYIVRYQDGKTVETKNTTYRATQLVQDRYYNFYVQAVSETGKSTWASRGEWTTDVQYDDEDTIVNKCSISTLENSYTLPADIKRAEGGKFELSIENNMNRNLNARIISIQRKGEIFQGGTPAVIQYDDDEIKISSKKAHTFEIRWSLPSGADKSYEGKKGEITVTVQTNC